MSIWLRERRVLQIVFYIPFFFSFRLWPVFQPSVFGYIFSLLFFFLKFSSHFTRFLIRSVWLYSFTSSFYSTSSFPFSFHSFSDPMFFFCISDLSLFPFSSLHICCFFLFLCRGISVVLNLILLFFFYFLMPFFFSVYRYFLWCLIFSFLSSSFHFSLVFFVCLFCFLLCRNILESCSSCFSFILSSFRSNHFIFLSVWTSSGYIIFQYLPLFSLLTISALFLLSDGRYSSFPYFYFFFLSYLVH